eukprot:5351642-Amphidinium_carterae.1
MAPQPKNHGAEIPFTWAAHAIKQFAALHHLQVWHCSCDWRGRWLGMDERHVVCRHRWECKGGGCGRLSCSLGPKRGVRRRGRRLS